MFMGGCPNPNRIFGSFPPDEKRSCASQAHDSIQNVSKNINQ